jgi:hypothetical protein
MLKPHLFHVAHTIQPKMMVHLQVSPLSKSMHMGDVHVKKGVSDVTHCLSSLQTPTAARYEFQKELAKCNRQRLRDVQGRFLQSVRAARLGFFFVYPTFRNFEHTFDKSESSPSRSG